MGDKSGASRAGRPERRPWGFFFFGLCALCSVLFLSGCQGSRHGSRVCLKGHCYSVEIAETLRSRERGLMFREGLQSGEGMLFIFESPAPHAFWMKNMAFPIDIIWADEGQRVVHIAPDFSPCQQDPCPVARPPVPSKYVLEVAAKESEKIGLRLGDVLDLRQIR